ncbi:alpha/beta fold hydrolase [Pseudalkalibacillus hwajinpoensis]|uniref:alpha/beta fold hydrolase n=1 Tax=Guptibacillus hwajinpoensis TaxID=208199 RepID=UPI001CD6DDCA|nr:alpha/beta fold hydrolase [Pseudalkalibacillus hwajinpoensis]MCA0993200.1 hypothetical protein [Pseudalkalibacillus hwajinpoensis]
MKKNEGENRRSRRLYLWMGESANPTIFLLHGLTNNALGFNEIANRLQDHFHLFAIDLPGHGETQPFNEGKKLFLSMSNRMARKGTF